MSQFLLDVSVNIFEVVAIIVLMLTTFRFSLKGYLTHALIAGTVMAQSSYLLRFVFHLDSVTPLVMLIWFIIFAWLVFRIQLFYALLMVVTSYLSYLTIQAVIILLLQIGYSMDEITGSLVNVKLIQVAGSIITICFAIWLSKKRIGFSFVPDRSVKVVLKGVNLLLLAICIVACLFISGVAYIFINYNFLYSTLSTFLFLSFILLVFLAFRKEL
ncbi:hypothetical protein [Cohnella herbarum]|uniref:Uncharacterized protein n=1 Tax=Cohnella herbarum TaxID=2728023 RepID=A0A7Z2VQB3_9BACL|nr:hypothetical protein [Cohnella herbarum]QJD87167.1 hypothetical protein HH215_30995 [Cohnella herbarum]